jgi:hypothetical protein
MKFGVKRIFFLERDGNNSSTSCTSVNDTHSNPRPATFKNEDDHALTSGEDQLEDVGVIVSLESVKL